MEGLMKMGKSLGAITAVISEVVRKAVCGSSAMQPTRGVAVALLLACASISAMPQQSPNLENGFKHWASYDGGSLDTVNNLNGNQMLHAPLLPDYPQRGGKLQMGATLYQTSKVWQV